MPNLKDIDNQIERINVLRTVYEYLMSSSERYNEWYKEQCAEYESRNEEVTDYVHSFLVDSEVYKEVAEYVYSLIFGKEGKK